MASYGKPTPPNPEPVIYAGWNAGFSPVVMPAEDLDAHFSGFIDGFASGTISQNTPPLPPPENVTVTINDEQGNVVHTMNEDEKKAFLKRLEAGGWKG